MDTSEIMTTLQNLRIGDKLIINDWRAKYTVCGISPHYVLAHYGQSYTIINMEPISVVGYAHNGIRTGDIVCAPDWWALGYSGGYDFTSEAWVAEYMNSLESGETEQSVRRASPVFFLSVIGHTDKVFRNTEAIKKAPSGA